MVSMAHGGHRHSRQSGTDTEASTEIWSNSQASLHVVTPDQVWKHGCRSSWVLAVTYNLAPPQGTAHGCHVCRYHGVRCRRSCITTLRVPCVHTELVHDTGGHIFIRVRGAHVLTFPPRPTLFTYGADIAPASMPSLKQLRLANTQSALPSTCSVASKTAAMDRIGDPSLSRTYYEGTAYT